MHRCVCVCVCVCCVCVCVCVFVCVCVCVVEEHIVPCNILSKEGGVSISGRVSI